MDEPIDKTGEEAKENVITDYYEGYQRLNLQSAEREVSKARNAIFVVAALSFLGGILQMSIASSFTTAEILITILIALLFLGLGFLAKKQPFGAIIIALVVYGGLWVLNIIVLGADYIFKGIIIKGIIIFYLVRAIPHAREAERIRKQLKES